MGNLPETASCTKEQWISTVTKRISEIKQRLELFNDPPSSVEVILKVALNDVEISNEYYSASFRSLLTDESKHVPFAHKPKGISKFLTGHSQCFFETMKENCEARDTEDDKLFKLVDAKDNYFKTAYNILKNPTIRKLEGVISLINAEMAYNFLKFIDDTYEEDIDDLYDSYSKNM